MIPATSGIGRYDVHNFVTFKLVKKKTTTTTRVERYTSRDIVHFIAFHYRSPKILTCLLTYLVSRK